jgi:hypothetical protein
MHALQWQWSYDKDLREPSVELAGYMFINKLKHKNHTLIKDTKDLGAFTPNYISNQQWSMSSSRTIKPSNCTIVSGSLIEFGLAPKSQIPVKKGPPINPNHWPTATVWRLCQGNCVMKKKISL